MSKTSSRIAFVFPGQGAQTVGMGRDLSEESSGRPIYDVFDRIVSREGNLKLSTVCFNGPEETLRRTLYTQPAILATSIAALTVFREQCPIQPFMVAGHSLGEYGALYTAGVLTLEESAQLIQRRAELMETAPAGAMSAVLGLDGPTVEALLADWQTKNEGVIALANDNSDAQVVISGQPEAVEAITPVLKAAGAKRIVPLAVGGAFHSPLMRAAADAFGETLAGFGFAEARCPVVSNVDAQPGHSGAELREKLSRQIDSPVRWTQTMRRMAEEGVDTVIEFGPGKVLTGLFGRTCPDLRLFNVSDAATARAVAGELTAVTGVPA
jgi:[acyl-carrier-protein] S-malonyltransferase